MKLQNSNTKTTLKSRKRRNLLTRQTSRPNFTFSIWSATLKVLRVAETVCIKKQRLAC